MQFISKAFKSSNSGRSDFSSIQLIPDNPSPSYWLYPGARVLQAGRPVITTISGRFRINLNPTSTSIITEAVAKLVPHYYARSEDGVSDSGRFPAICCKMEPPALTQGDSHIDMPFALELDCDAFPVSPTCQMTTKGLHQVHRLFYTIEIVLTVENTISGGMSTIHEVFPRATKAATFAHSSHECQRYVCIKTSPSPPDRLPDPLDVEKEIFVEDVGSLQVRLLARQVIVGGIVFVRLVFAGTSDTSLYGYKLSLEETLEWTSPKESGPRWISRPRLRLMANKRPILRNKDKDAAAEDSDALQAVSFHARFPDDHSISPSTLPFTKSPMTIRHRLVLETTLYNAQTTSVTEKAFFIPVLLAVCSLIAEGTILPTYGSTPLNHTEFQPERPNDAIACSCGMSDKMLLERDGIIQWAVDPIDTQTAESAQPVVRNMHKTPAATLV